MSTAWRSAYAGLPLLLGVLGLLLPRNRSIISAGTIPKRSLFEIADMPVDLCCLLAQASIADFIPDLHHDVALDPIGLKELLVHPD